MDPTETGGISNDKQQLQIGSFGDPSNPFDLDAAAASVTATGSESGGIPPQYSIFSAGFNSTTPAGIRDVPLQDNPNGRDDAAEHDVALSLYFALDYVNPNVAGDLLRSYHTISRITGDITGAINSTIGLSDDIPAGQIGDPTQEHIANAYSNNVTNNAIDLARWIRFLLSFDALPYYVIILSAYMIVKVFRMLRRRI